MKKRRAFSFVEVMFALFLLSVSATIVVATMPLATKSRARADMNNKATGLAQKELEAIRGLGYQNATPTQLYANGLIDSTTPVATNTYSFTAADGGSLDNVSRVLPSGTGTVKIEQVDLELRRITVTVNWTERQGNRTVVLGTLVANL